MDADGQLPASPHTDLQQLADALDPRHFVTTLVTRPGRVTCLTVASRATPLLSEDIYARHGWYWWSWAERIALAGDAARAAAVIARVLGTGPADPGVPASSAR